MRWGALRSTQRRKEESRYEGLARATSYFVRGAKALGHQSERDLGAGALLRSPSARVTGAVY